MKRICIQWLAVGVLGLSSCCEIPSDGAVGLPQAPPQVLSALEHERAACIRRTQNDFPGALRGGPGFTRDTAWKVLIKDRAAVSFEYLVLGRLALGEPQLQSLVEHDGRYYDVHLIEVEHDGERYRAEQWFDITPYFKAL